MRAAFNLQGEEEVIASSAVADSDVNIAKCGKIMQVKHVNTKDQQKHLHIQHNCPNPPSYLPPDPLDPMTSRDIVFQCVTTDGRQHMLTPVQTSSRCGMDLYLKASLAPGSGRVPPVYDPPPKEGVVWVQNPGHTSCILLTAGPAQVRPVQPCSNDWASVKNSPALHGKGCVRH